MIHNFLAVAGINLSTSERAPFFWGFRFPHIPLRGMPAGEPAPQKLFQNFIENIFAPKRSLGSNIFDPKTRSLGSKLIQGILNPYFGFHLPLTLFNYLAHAARKIFWIFDLLIFFPKCLLLCFFPTKGFDEGPSGI